MALETIVGQQTNAHASQSLLQAIQGLDLQGTLYLGYPVIASVDEPRFIDALLTTCDNGVVVFEFPDLSGPLALAQIEERHNDLWLLIEAQLKRERSLVTGRDLAVEIGILTYFPSNGEIAAHEQVATPDTLAERIRQFPGVTPEQLRLINASVQRVSTMKPVRRRLGVQKQTSLGAKLKEIEREIANLDHWQKMAAIETPDSIQRIRGLAGSGKTIVLALKAAYLHARHPQWRIALTFHTRSLYQQLRDLLRRFTFEHTRDEPDWDQLQLIHAWGSKKAPGFYSGIADRAGAPIRDFMQAKQRHPRELEFGGVCSELLADLPSSGANDPAHFDAVLIDEAQDLPQPFFELAFHATKSPHRVAFAYDELQNLSRYRMAPPSELFGSANGNPRVSDDLQAPAGQARKDIVLPICYRNTSWALTIAHALGFGIYRDRGLIQFFNDPELWQEIGYETVSGRVHPGEEVSLRRRADATPDYFSRLLDPAEAVSSHVFPDATQQAKWVAEQISENLTRDELEPQDILVIFPEPRTVQAEAAALIRALDDRGLSAHIAGVTSSRDQLYVENSIAISGIYRAKGNEAPMVYVMNSEYCYESILGLIRRRNILFTAITRSRAWVRICGVGDVAQGLVDEVQRVIATDYTLSFTVPTQEELERLRKIHRDRPPREESVVSDAQKGLEELVSMLEAGEIAEDNLDPGLLRRVRRVLGSGESDDGE